MLSEYLWIIIVAFSGGFASYSQQVWVAKTKPYSTTAMLVELFTAGFAGVIMYLLCQSMQLNPMLQAAAVGVAGHMGTRFLYAMHATVCNYIKCKKE